MTILDLFDRARAAHGPRTALEIAPANDGPAVAIDYDTLDAMADEAAALLAPFAAADAVIALTLPRSDPWLYACMLGVMRTGAAYVAIDPAFPARQAVEILDDAAATVLVARPARAAEIAAAGARAPTLDPPGTACATVTVRPFRRPHIAPTSLAYVIYTSGTTGKPKGVEIEHRSILNLVHGDVEAFGLGARERVAQGSSASYDSSIEEIWLAWAVGGAVVVMDDETARLGPDLLPWLVRRRITVLCPPPTLLRTLACDDPQAALPELRLLYVGGEALPPDLADLWSRGRRLENGYGPTECTVTCLRATVRPGEPVTIGRAIPGSTAFVIDADDPALRVIEDDAHGELVVGGASLARGYRGQPETTAARFIDHPQLGRVYRTGDLVHRDADGAFHYHGRIDAQVKLRGYRVELGAVEARLAAHPSVIEAACTVEGEGTQRRLVAHVVLAAGAALDAEALRAFVADALPRYMVPAAIAPIAAVPRSIGGKLDRKRLPRVGDVPAAPVRVAPPEGELERLVAEAIAAVLARPVETVSADADFFDELGLDSLTVAMAISRLRANAATRAATVRLAYAHRTVRAVAQALGPTPDAEIHRTAATEPTAHGVPRPLLATTLQALFLAAMLVAGAQLLWIPDAGDWLASGVAHPIANAAAVAIVGAVAVVAYSAGVLLLALSAKWLLIGRYRPARVRAWSMWHLRHWIVVRLAALAPWDLFELVGAAPAVLQLFGARIGSRVHIHRGVRLGDGGWDLLTLEDDATVGQDACLRVLELEAGCLVFGTVTVRRAATLETRAGLSPGAELGPECILRPLSNLRAGEVHAGAILDGVPARHIGLSPTIVRSEPRRGSANGILLSTCLVVAILAMLLVPWWAALAGFGLALDGSLHETLFPGDALLPDHTALLRIAGAIVVAGMATVLVQAGLVRCLGRAPHKRYALDSLAASRLSLQSALVDAAGKWLSGTLMWPIWLRLAGARIGAGCEISTITDVVPSTVRIGEGTFFADGIYLGGPRLRAGWASIETVELGRGCFVGNHAVLAAGTRLADGTLVGVSTASDGLPHEPGASWFGHPPFRLPRREIVEMPRSLTHDPSLIRRVNRWAWELARFALPVWPAFIALTWYRAMEITHASFSAPVFRLLLLPVGVLAALATLCASVLVLKWVLIGRVRPGTHALWSCWCSRWDFLYVAWGMWASVPLAFLEGTLLLVGYLRAMGCRIGHRALLGHGFAHVVDPDMLRFGDDVTVDALFQAHTFEDRVLKVDHVDLRDGCTIGPNTVILYGADIGPRAQVLPHSVVMKREVLAGGARYEGAPTQPV